LVVFFTSHATPTFAPLNIGFLTDPLPPILVASRLRILFPIFEGYCCLGRCTHNPKNRFPFLASPPFFPRGAFTPPLKPGHIKRWQRVHLLGCPVTSASGCMRPPLVVFFSRGVAGVFFFPFVVLSLPNVWAASPPPNCSGSPPPPFWLRTHPPALIRVGATPQSPRFFHSSLRVCCCCCGPVLVVPRQPHFSFGSEGFLATRANPYVSLKPTL